MKKVILFAAFAVVAVATQAQVKFGAKAGVNLANTTEDLKGDGSLVSFHVGGFANIPVADKLTVQPELLYSGEGDKEGSDKINLNYINIPVMLQYDVASGFYLEAGPQLGILVSAKSAGTDVKSFLNSTNFGAAFGLGYKMASGLGFGARYNLGLTNIVKSSGGGTGKTGSFAIGLSYTFGGSAASKD